MWLGATLEVPEHPSILKQSISCPTEQPAWKTGSMGLSAEHTDLFVYSGKQPKYQFSGFSPTSASAEALHILFPVLCYFGPANGLQSRGGLGYLVYMKPFQTLNFIPAKNTINESNHSLQRDIYISFFGGHGRKKTHVPGVQAESRIQPRATLSPAGEGLPCWASPSELLSHPPPWFQHLPHSFSLPCCTSITEFRYFLRETKIWSPCLQIETSN